MKQKDDIVVIDRVEGSIAVAEINGQICELNIKTLPVGIKEGSVLRKTEQGFVLDTETENKRRAQLFNKQNSLFKRK